MSPIIVYRFEDKDGFGPFTGKEGLNCVLGPKLKMRMMPEPKIDGITWCGGYSFGFAGREAMYKQVSFADMRLMANHGIRLRAFMVMSPDVQWGKSQVAFIRGEATRVSPILV